MTNTKKTRIILISVSALITILLIVIASSNNYREIFVKQDNNLMLAQSGSGYVPLTRTGAADTNLFDDGDFDSIDKVLSKIFQWGIVTALVLAVLFIFLGSIQYMTTDAVFDKKEGITKIQSAIGGLILALVSWLILNTINENILSMQIGVTQVGGTSPMFTPSQVENLNQTLDEGVEESVNTNASTNLPGGSNVTVTSGEIPGISGTTTNTTNPTLQPGSADYSFPTGVTDWSSLNGSNTTSP
jgi:hypothetical protein